MSVENFWDKQPQQEIQPQLWQALLLITMRTVAVMIREGDYPVFTTCQALSTYLFIFATAYKMLASVIPYLQLENWSTGRLNNCLKQSKPSISLTLGNVLLQQM